LSQKNWRWVIKYESGGRNYLGLATSSPSRINNLKNQTRRYTQKLQITWALIAMGFQKILPAPYQFQSTPDLSLK